MKNLIDDLTPTIIAVTGTIGGCLIMIVGIVNNLDESKFHQISNFAIAMVSASIGGASGIAVQSSKSKDAE